MTTIYKQHDAAFKQVSAYMIMWKTKEVATIAIKFPRDGAIRLYAYVHWIGLEMVRGYATGYGYDKRTAACSSAVKRIVVKDSDTTYFNCPEAYPLFFNALEADNGQCWDSALREAGFEVLQAV